MTDTSSHPNLSRAASGTHFVYRVAAGRVAFVYVKRVVDCGMHRVVRGFRAEVSATVSVSGDFAEPHAAWCVGGCACCRVCGIPDCACCHAARRVEPPCCHPLGGPGACCAPVIDDGAACDEPLGA